MWDAGCGMWDMDVADTAIMRDLTNTYDSTTAASFVFATVAMNI